MTIHYSDADVTLYHGDCLDVLRQLPDNSVDSVVTDPPYGLANTDPAHVADTLVRWVNGDRDYIPSGAGFMGKAWDAFVPPVAVWDECLRVLKPGGHCLAFAGSRTVDLMTIGLRLAGFDIRDSIAWLYGSGFPKSLDVSKAIDKLDATDERRARAVEFQTWLREHLTPQRINALTGTDMGHHLTTHPTQPAVATADLFDRLRPHLPVVPERIEELVRQRTVESVNYAARAVTGSRTLPDARTRRLGFAGETYGGDGAVREVHYTDAHTEDARAWQGWGTALKPAFEPIVVARKPLAGTVAANVLAHGTGALNIDSCRVEPSDRAAYEAKCASVVGLDSNRNGSAYGEWSGARADSASPGGRWPTNVVLDGAAAQELDRQVPKASTNPAGVFGRQRGDQPVDTSTPFAVRKDGDGVFGYGDSGGASRFFPVFRYEAKAPTSERPRVAQAGATGRVAGASSKSVRVCNECGNRTCPPGGSPWPACGHEDWEYVTTQVSSDGHIAHPTVKPLDLMRWLVRLVTPSGGTVLDPFAGSGTTAEAAVLEGMRCIAIEREADYLPLIVQRLSKPLQVGFDFGELG